MSEICASDPVDPPEDEKHEETPSTPVISTQDQEMSSTRATPEKHQESVTGKVDLPPGSEQTECSPVKMTESAKSVPEKPTNIPPETKEISNTPQKPKINLVPEYSGTSSDESDSSSSESETEESSSGSEEETEDAQMKIEESSDDSDDDSSTSSSSDSLPCVDGVFMCDEEKDLTKVPQFKVPGEITLAELPPIEELTISVTEKECTLLGQVSSIVEQLVMVQSYPGIAAVDLDTILFLDKGEKPLGKVFDVIGPIHEPIYCIRFNSNAEIHEKMITIGLAVYCAPMNKTCTNFVVLPQIMNHKGSDASWRDDIEPGDKYLDYSDDEQERNARRQRKTKQTGAPNDGTYNPNFRAQTPTTRPSTNRPPYRAPPRYRAPQYNQTPRYHAPRQYPPQPQYHQQYMQQQNPYQYPPPQQQQQQPPTYYQNPYGSRFYANPYAQPPNYSMYPQNYFQNPPPPPPPPQ